ncbi:MAG TPA: universal stress protein [Leptolyngbyaceae cyanobacterium]
MGFQKILVALDNSPASRLIFEHGLDLAKSNRAMLRLFHCLNSDVLGESMQVIPVELGFYPEYMAYSYQSKPQLAKERLEQAHAVLNKYCEIATEQGIKADFDCQIGEAAPSVCQAAEKWGADLLVVGRRGRSGLTEALMGSVSNYVLHHSHCSVLVIQGKSEVVSG